MLGSFKIIIVACVPAGTGASAKFDGVEILLADFGTNAAHLSRAPFGAARDYLSMKFSKHWSLGTLVDVQFTKSAKLHI